MHNVLDTYSTDVVERSNTELRSPNCIFCSLHHPRLLLFEMYF